VVDAEIEDPAHPDHVGPDRVEALLVSPLGGLDATALRALARTLRAGHPAPASSRELLRRAVLEPGFVEAFLDAERAGELAGSRDALRLAARLADLVARARAALAEGETVEQVLWVLWSGTSWPRRLRSATGQGGQAARLAHRDLDAICALFEVAAT